MPRAKPAPRRAAAAPPPPPSAPAASTERAPRPSRTIPTALHREVVERLAATDPATGRPYTARAVAAWLAAERGVRCSHMAVLRVQALATERGEQLLVAALREELRDAVAPARRRLEAATKHLATILPTERNVSKVAAGVRALTASLDSLTKLSGVAKPVTINLTSGGDPLDVAVARFAANLARTGLPDDPGAAAGAARDAAENDGGNPRV